MPSEPRSDRYNIVRRIGEGGMGVVYEAVDLERNAKVALKTVRKASPSALARFKREFRSLTDVVHPNLVTLYELVADEDDVFFTMELVEGTHFNRWVRARTSSGDDTEQDPTSEHDDSVTHPTIRIGSGRQPQATGTLDVLRLRQALRQLAEGLSAIHRAGVLHRDIKPANVIVTPERRVVILDFGLATELAAEASPGADDRPLEGTVAFMSPEQAARQPLTPASDWYSVGVMLFSALTGRMPFVGGRDDILMDKQRFEPPPPQELARDLPVDLCTLCSELLRTQPDRRPSGAEILRRLGVGPTAGQSSTSIGSSSHISGTAIVGRERELGVLRDALQTADRGHAAMVEVAGISGVGKSRLVRGFLSDLGPNALVLSGRCYEHEMVPFKAVDSLIDDLARHLLTLPAIEVEGLMPRDALSLARAFPVLRQVEAFTARRRRLVASTDPQELRRRVFVALRELLTRLADRQPLLLVIDDLQWGDVDSAALLAALLRPPDPPPMLVIGTHRTEDEKSSSFLLSFARYAGDLGIRRTRLEVRELSEDHARELAALHLVGQPDAEDHAIWIAQESSGNPLFVEELARHMSSAEAQRRGWASLDDALSARVKRLPQDAARLLGMVAVAGRPVHRNLAMRAAEVTDPAQLSLLRAGSFVRTRLIAGERMVECYHDRIRQATTDLLGAARLPEFHERLARAFESTKQPDPEALAIHYRGAGDLRHAAQFAVQAAQRASQAFAFDRAAGFYEIAIENDPRNRDLLVALGDARANAGRGSDAADAYLAAVASSDNEAEILDLRCRASWQLLASGYIDRGLHAIENVLDALKLKYPSSPRTALASVVWGRLRMNLRGLRFRAKDEREVPATRLAQLDALFAAAQLLGMAEAVRSADFHVRSLRMALQVGEPKRVARALVGEAVFVSLAGTTTTKRADAILERVRQMSDALNDPVTRGLRAGGEGMTHFNLGRFERSLEFSQEAERIFREECTGNHWEIATAQLFQGFCLALIGRVQEMIERYPAIVKEANERGNLYAATSFKACLGFYVPLARDDPDGADAEVNDAMERWTADGYHLQHANAFSSRVVIDLYRGEGQRALDRCASEWPALTRSLLLRTQVIRVLCWGGRGRAALCAHEQGAGDDVLRVARRARRILAGEGAAYAVGQAHALAAGIEFRLGNRDAAVASLREAVRLAHDGEIHMNARCFSRALGVILGGDEGAALVNEADEFFANQGLANPAAVARMFAPGFDQ